MITLGVEEEYLLVDPESGMPLPCGDQVRAAADLQPALSGGEVQPELLQAQVEVATPVCESLDEVAGHLLRLRHVVGTAAEALGCRLVASGTAPFAADVPAPVTESPRYRNLHADAPQLVSEQLINGMHVHASVPDRDTGVQVLNRLRSWIPLLVALSANSPLWHGRDTGFASWRTVVFGRWPVVGVPPRFTDAADYDRRVNDLVETRTIRDHGQLYWQARLSERYPTVEVRAMDVQLRAEDAGMLAGLVRAMVATAVREAHAGCPPPAVRGEILSAAVWQAARYGTTDALLDCSSVRLRKVGDMVSDLLCDLDRALEDSGDQRHVASLVHRLLQEGSPADRQRQARERGGARELMELLTHQSIGL